MEGIRPVLLRDAAHGPWSNACVHHVRPVTTRKKILLGVAVILWAPIIALLGHGYIYKPLKFRYLVSRVESARSAVEEKQAFALAVNWGRVWEVGRLRPEDWPASLPRPQSGWLLCLEWLESSPYRGAAYRAYRGVIDTNNLFILWSKK